MDIVIFIVFGVIVAGIVAYKLIFDRGKKNPDVVEVPDVKPPIIEKPAKVFSWPDRRPIGMIMLASYDGIFKQDNPMNWAFPFADSDFKKGLMLRADECISNMKEMNAQGMIVWDIEGQQYAHPASYIGDPTFLPAQTELHSDEFFRKFRDAGFRVGVCVRPDRIEYNADKTWITHYSVKDPFTLLKEKIKYAAERWGCTIFYIDSNVWPGSENVDVAKGGDILPSIVIEELSKEFPEFLLIPEWKDFEHFKFSAPLYISMNKRPDGTPESIILSQKHKEMLPNSFLVAAVNSDSREIEESVKQGNIMLFAAWWKDPNNQRIKQAYETH